MIISRTPFRISFFGGGTDYPAWFREHGGSVLATTINRYSYITCRFLPPFFEHKSRIVWSKIELVNREDEVTHPIIREAVKYLGIEEGIEIHHEGDLPARSGLGSSSAAAVGILNALYALRGDMVSKSKLAREAIYLEQDLLKEYVGVQDQIATAFGGLNRIDINRDGSFQVRPVVVSDARLRDLENHMLVFYTGIARHASSIAADQISAIPQRQNELRAMGKMVDLGTEILVGNGELADFGRLLHEAWQIKRSISEKIAPAFVDDIYERAMKAGAVGGKLLGAGGGGFMLFVVPPDDHPKVLSALSELLVVPVEFERSGTQIIFYDPPRYSRTAHKRRDFQRYGVGMAGDAPLLDEAQTQQSNKSQTNQDAQGIITLDAFKRPA
jgi:D-glycero-alpha-D-manno-heptose-7-phosphate kinase